MEFLSARVADTEDTFKKDDLIYLLKDIRNSLEKSIEHKELVEILKSIKSLAARIDEFFKTPTQARSKEFETLEKSKNTFAEKITAIENELKAVDTQESEIAKNLEGFNEQFKKAFELKEVKKDEIRNLENQKKYSVFDNEKIDIKVNDAKSEWLRSERSSEEFESLLNQLPATNQPERIVLAGDKQIQFDELERKIFRLRAELMSIGEIDESLVKEAQEVEVHYNHLSTQSVDLKKASDDLKNMIIELKEQISVKFNNAFKEINDEFNKFFQLMFGGGFAKLKLKVQTIKTPEIMEGEIKEEIIEKEEEEEKVTGVEIELSLPKKRISSLDILSGGEKSLVSIAALFALISVSPPPFLVLDEIDAPLDEKNSARFADLIKDFAKKVQFVVVTHNRTVMEAADVLYGVTMNDDGTSKLLSLKLEEVRQ